MTRRDFLATSTVGVLSASPLARAFIPGHAWRLGVQSYSLRGLKLDAALAATRELGLEWWEGWEGHVPISDDPAVRSENRLKLRQAGVKMRTFGVVGFGGDFARNRRLFEFARTMGVETLSADPSPEALSNLESLTEEYGIRIAIHNHGPGSRYDKIESVVNAVKGRTPKMGACVDTGHFLRSKEDPAEAVKRLEGRVFGVHLKDVKDATKFMVLGKGDLNAVAVLRELYRQKFDGIMAIEHEENPHNPMPDLKECVAHVGWALGKL